MKLVACVVFVVACGSSDATTPVVKSADPAPAQPAVAAAGSGEKKHHEDRHDAAVAAAQLDLEVTVDGKAVQWHAADFAKVANLHGQNNDGDARDVWSLRDLVHTLVGPTARLVAVHGEGDKQIFADAWNDPTHVPILHNTRKGKLKFRWTDQQGTWQDTQVVKDVAKLDVVTK